ncbi:MAG: monovalent cation/H(+) antiporter subunit G [Candidatus Accumulibacter sp.]|jgi:multicomponent K+:H+ antiporter subunit G|nr:monovalent cation/H(+) antiporter subunit G [Accumulibacter sp.]
MNGDLPLWAALPAALLLVCGGLITLIGAFGMYRLESFHARVHAPTLGASMGMVCVLLASMLVSSALENRLVIHELLILLFVFMTSPVTTMLLMRAAMFHRRG